MRHLHYIAIVLLAIGCSKTSETTQDNSTTIKADVNQEQTKMIEEGKKSEVKERKLLENIEIGMSESEYKKAWRQLGEEQKLRKKNEAYQKYGTLTTEYGIYDHYYEYRKGNEIYYMSVFPHFINGKLVNLTLNVIQNNEKPVPKDLYRQLADDFSKTERGKQFKRFEYVEDTKNDYVTFIKDNLKISFLPGDVCIIDYTNLPDQEDLFKEYEKNSNSANSL